MILGIFLRVWQYLAERSLWLDEAFLAHNIRARGFGELAGPLDWSQAAPPAFLWAEKLSTVLFGPTERAMRLLPLLCGCAAMVGFTLLARRCLRPVAAVVAVALFASHDSLIYYSSEVKQYSTDVLAAVALLWVAERCRASRLSAGWVLAYAVLGAVTIWFSHAAIFVVAGVGAALALVAAREGDWAGLGRLVAAGTVPAGSLSVLYSVSLRHLAHSEFLQDYWASAFLPFPPRGWADVRQSLRLFYELVSRPGELHPAPLGAAVVLLGIGVLGRGRRAHLAIWLAPAALLAVAAALGKYPMGGRLALFLVPALLLLVGAGIGWVVESRARWAAAAGWIAAAVLVAVPLWRDARLVMHPRMRQEIRPVLRVVAEHHWAGDRVYVQSDCWPAFSFYAREFGLNEAGAVRGRFPEEALAEYHRDLDAFAGAPRVWVLFSHIRATEGEDADRYILGELDRMGRRLETYRADGAAAYLYDLSGAAAAAAK
jgi:hypothetical protein